MKNKNCSIPPHTTKALLDYLAKKNSAYLCKDEFSKFSKLVLSIERRLLHCEARRNAVAPTTDTDDDMFWNRIMTLCENYRRFAWKRIGMKLNLQCPDTLAEKIEWLKFNDHHDTHVQLCDKLGVRDYVIEKTGNSTLLNKLLFSKGFNSTSEISFECLPEQFVIKSNHWSGDALICSNSEPIASAQLDEIDLRLRNKYGDYTKSEWPYWHIRPRVFVEEYLEDQFGQLVDYKIFCFNGEPKFIMVCMDRFLNRKKLFFDPDWKLLPFTDCKNPPIKIGTDSLRPGSLDEMLQYASMLSEGMAFLRVDFYDIDGECRFGELTLYPESGIDCRFQPVEWNTTIGGWLKLPEPNRNPKFAFGALFGACSVQYLSETQSYSVHKRRT